MYTVSENTMGVKEVRVSILSGGLIDGNASVSFDNGICIRQIKVIIKEDGAIVRYPSYQSKAENKTKNYVYPLTQAAQDQLNEIIVNAYREEKERQRK